MKNLLSLTLCIILLLSTISLLSVSAETITFDDFEYEIINNEVTITGYIGNAQKLTIPSVIDGKPVTAIGKNAFFACESLTEITIPQGVISIDEFAFSLCKSLTKISLPDSITSIGEYAFHNCDALTKITIPDGVSSIETCAFQLCKSLTIINIPQSVTYIGNCAFYDCDSLTDVYYAGTEAQWQSIKKDYLGNETLLNTIIHYNASIKEPTEPTKYTPKNNTSLLPTFLICGAILLVGATICVTLVILLKKKNESHTTPDIQTTEQK